MDKIPNLPAVRGGRILQYEPHPIANSIPVMSADVLAELTRSIKAHGQIHDIVLFERKILEGRGRYLACLASGTEPRFREFDPAVEGDPIHFILNSNLVRRNLWDPSQRAMIAAGLVQSGIGSNQHSEAVTIGTACRLLGISRQSVHRAKRLRAKSEVAAAAVAEGRMSIGSADMLTKLPAEYHHLILSEPIRGPKLKKKINEALRAFRHANPVTLPEGRFNVVVSDPAWPVDDIPYLRDGIAQIETDHRIWLAEKAADDCFLFLWTTQAHLFAALKMIESLGWKYIFKKTWHKIGGHKHPNRPTYNDEFVLVATKGSPKFLDTRGFRTCFRGVRRKHSEKPEEFFEMVKQATSGPRLELYARRPHNGFVPHGDEIDWSEPPQRSSPVRNRVSHLAKWIAEAMEMNSSGSIWAVAA